MKVKTVKQSVERVRAALSNAGVDVRITEFAESTRTAEDAARAIGTLVGQIVKSLVFASDKGPVLSLISGTNRLDPIKLRNLCGCAVERADVQYVREHTGYAIGGVPPLGHATQMQTYIDRDLLQYDTVWAAAGTPHAVFSIAPDVLVQITNATVADIAEE